MSLTTTNKETIDKSEILFFKVFRNVYLNSLINNSYFIFDISNSRANGNAYFEDEENKKRRENNTIHQNNNAQITNEPYTQHNNNNNTTTTTPTPAPITMLHIQPKKTKKYSGKSTISNNNSNDYLDGIPLFAFNDNKITEIDENDMRRKQEKEKKEKEEKEKEKEKEKEEKKKEDNNGAIILAVASVATVAAVGTFYYFYNKRKEYNIKNSYDELIKNNNGDKKKFGSFILTDDHRDTIGSVWSNIKIPLVSNISIKFKFQISLPTPPNEFNNSNISNGNLGGDGFAVVFQNNGIKSISNGHGSSLGYHGIKNGLVAIEFDTYKNDGESNDNHISIQGTTTGSGSTTILSSDHKQSIASVQPKTNLKDGDVHSVEIFYNKSDNTLSVTMDSILLLRNIKAPNLKNVSSSFIGFTSSTGYYHSSTRILNCEIKKQK